jgi:dTDP-4-amino-4,6-dideoxygalactose transaminase
VTDDAALAEHMTMLARHGGLVKHKHLIEGINSRLGGMQAAILSPKLRHLQAWTRARQEAATVYDAASTRSTASKFLLSRPITPTSIISTRSSIRGATRSHRI